MKKTERFTVFIEVPSYLREYVMCTNGLTIPETVVCRDINYAIKLNFPEKYRSGIRLGFYRPAIEKQQDVNPENRMTNQDEL